MDPVSHSAFVVLVNIYASCKYRVYIAWIESREKTQTFVTFKSMEINGLGKEEEEEENVLFSPSHKLKETGVLGEKGKRQPCLGLSWRPRPIPPCQP